MLGLSALLTGLADGALEGRVVGVADGDTLTLHVSPRESVKVRLAGIDAPEAGQAFGQAARHFTRELVAGRTVRVIPRDRDRYGRLVGEVLLADGRSLNRELVRAGYAWWYRAYSDELSLGWLELQAHLERRGLWADPDPVAPWEWRRQRTAPRRR